LDLRILKDLARQIVELRILKNLGKPTADSSQLTVRKKDDDMTGGTPTPPAFWMVIKTKWLQDLTVGSD
jgi:hypothetical protein